MSSKEDTSNTMMCCASCGKAEGDGIQLRTCTACKSVRYCDINCQRSHRPKHKKACKERAAELRDEILSKQPEGTHLGDCPICFLPHSLDESKYVTHECCSKIVCEGCDFANLIRAREERLVFTCPFCRDTAEKDEAKQRLLKRVQANDPNALARMGKKRYEEGNYTEAFQYCSKAAELGNADAHYRLSILYRKGQGVEKNEKKWPYHAEEAAIRGHLDARYVLALYELSKFRPEMAKKHLMIAVNLGHDESLKELKMWYTSGREVYVSLGGMVSKEDFAAALRAHKAAVDATKSPHRNAVEAFKAARKM